MSGGRESFVSAADTRNPSRFGGTGAGRSGVSYLALHPMGFSVPRRLRFARCALTAPFHPCHFEISNLRFEISKGGLFSVALSVEAPALACRDAARVYPLKSQISNLKSQRLRGIAPFGVRTFLPALSKTVELFSVQRLETFCRCRPIVNFRKGWAILRPSPTTGKVTDGRGKLKERIPVRAQSPREFALTFAISNE